MKRGLANTLFSARTQRFTAAAAEIQREPGRERKEGKIYMYVTQTNSGKWGGGGSVKTPSWSCSMSDGVKRSALS